MPGRTWFSTMPPCVLSVLAIWSLALAASTTSSSAAVEPAQDISTITLVEQRPVDIKNSELIALSPDGESLAVSRPAGPQPTRLCIHEVATLTERVCADVGALGPGLWIDSVVWSPDGTRLAFAELWPQLLVDGDLWLMEAATGELTNLLDDAYDGDLGLTPGDGRVPEGDITLPSYPAFTADSAAVTFSRTRLVDGEFRGSDVVTIPIEGGDPVGLRDLERETPGSEYLGKHWSADGSRLLVSLVEYVDAGLGPDSGIWAYDGDGEEARQLSRVDDWPPRILAVSPRGELLLGVDPTTRGLRGPSYALVDGTSGARKPIQSLRPEAGGSEPISGAMLSPDGGLLLTVSGGGERQVAVRDLAGEGERVLLHEPSGVVPSDLGGEVLTWARNDTVLVKGVRPGRGTLLVLDRGAID